MRVGPPILRRTPRLPQFRAEDLLQTDGRVTAGLKSELDDDVDRVPRGSLLAVGVPLFHRELTPTERGAQGASVAPDPQSSAALEQ